MDEVSLNAYFQAAFWKKAGPGYFGKKTNKKERFRHYEMFD